MAIPLDERLEQLEVFLMTLPQDTTAHQETVREAREEIRSLKDEVSQLEDDHAL